MTCFCLSGAIVSEINRNFSTSISRLVSSLNSLARASAALSPQSTPPPGTSQYFLSFFVCSIKSILSSSISIPATLTLGLVFSVINTLLTTVFSNDYSDFFYSLIINFHYLQNIPVSFNLVSCLCDFSQLILDISCNCVVFF